MKNSDKNGLLFVMNILFTLLISYCLIRYTSLMKADAQCSLVKTNQRELLYWVGMFMIANLILTVLIKY